MTIVFEPVSHLHAHLLGKLHHNFKKDWDGTAIAELLSLPSVFGFLALTDAPSGFILCQQAIEQVDILTILVVPKYRRQGIASALISQACKNAVVNKAEQMFLEVQENNLPALALYSSLGFRKTGTRKRYYKDGSDALVLVRDI